MKRIFTLLFAAMLAGQAWAEDFTIGKLLYTVTDETNHYVSVSRASNYDTPSGDLVIPESVTDPESNVKYTVTAIANYAFHSCADITSVSIPGTVTTIGMQAFYNCSSLTTVSLPSSITEIRFDDAFAGCISLASINVAEGNANYASEDGVLFNNDKTRLLYYPACKTGSTYSIPGTVTTISSSAFENCGNLTSITIPNSVKTIYSSAFRNCSNLTSITIPESVFTLGNYAFYGCVSLTEINVASGNRNYSSEDGVLFNSSKTKLMCYPASKASSAYTVPESVTSIDEAAFYGCSNLKLVVIPNTVTSLGDGIFQNCASLESATLPNSITYIPAVTFGGCTNLTSIEIPSTVTFIGNSAFSECGLTTLEIPSSVTEISDFTFQDCQAMTSVLIPISVSDIGMNAFKGCSNASFNCEASEKPDGWHDWWNYDNRPVVWGYDSGTKKWTVTVSANNSSYGSVSGGGTVKDGATVTITATPAEGYRFVKWSNGLTSSKATITVTSNLNLVAEFAENGGSLVASELHYNITSGSTVEVAPSNDYKNMTEVVIPETVEIDGKTYTVTRIGEDAFRDCEKLNSFNLPKSINTFNTYSLDDCSSLTEINVDEENPAYSSVDGVLFNKNKTELIRYPQGKSSSSYTIPSSVTDIHSGAFEYCPNLTSVSIPNSVKHIGNFAFYGCTSLKGITIPEGITKIEMQTFEYCSSLSSVTIPQSVTEIKNNSFEDCTSLKSITIPSSVTYIGNTAFRGCYNLTDMNLAGNEYYSFENQALFNKGKTELLCYMNSKATDYTIPNTVTRIDDYAFCLCQLSSVTIPESVTSIGSSAFMRCWNLNSVTIPNSVTDIESYAFEDCYNLESFILTESVNRIGYKLFDGCNNLALNEFGNSCYIGTADNPYYALVKVKSNDITSCEIHKDCKVIAKYAFDYCDNLKYNEYDNALYLGNAENPCIMLIKATSTDIESCKIGDGCRFIDNSAFMNCKKLKSITIPNGVTNIGENAFYSCEKLATINIPESVRSIDQYAFYNCESLTSITIPDGVTAIENSAFYNCRSLASATIPNSITSIGNWAFSHCPMTEINISESVTKIGEGALYDCDKLNQIKIPNSVTSIGERAFSECNNLTIFCEAEAKPVGWDEEWNSSNRPVVWGFDPSMKIFNVALSADSEWRGKVTGGGLAAEGSKVTITATPEDGYHFVKWSNGLTTDTATITVTSDTTLVAEFAEDKYWTVTLSANIEHGRVDKISGSNLDGSIFTAYASPFPGYKFVKWSNGLTTDTISITLTSDTTLTAEFAEKVYAGTCGDDARWSFSMQSKTLTISGTGSIDKYKTVDLFSTEVDRPWQEIADQIEKVVIGEGITNLGSRAFCYLNNLKEVNISSTCNGYGSMSFANCPNLEKMVVAANSVYQANEYCFSNYETCTVYVPAGRVDYYKKDIIFGMFSNIVGGYTVTIDDEIKNGTVEVESYIVPEGGTVTVTPIPDEGYSIADVYFEGEYGYDCYTINSNSHQFWIENVRSNIVVKVEFSREGDFEFGFNYKILSDNTIEISSYKGTGGDVIIPSTVIDNGVEYTVTRIGDNAFSKNNSNIETIIIPNTVTSIGSGAFSNLYLTSLTIPNSVTEIGEGAFWSIKNIVYKGNATGSPWEALTVNGYIDGNCIFADAEKTHLTAYINPSDTIETTIYIPEDVISIGANAFTNVWAKKIDDGYYLGNDENPYLILWHVGDFMGDSEITSYEIHDGCKYIYYTAFANMGNLVSVTIPNSVISIGKLAFFGCDNLKSVNIPDGVVAIGEGAFSNCYGLSSITIPKSVTTIDKYAFGDCDNLTITCEVSSKPEGWDNEWNSPSSTVNWAEIDVAITETAANAINIYALGNIIVVENATDEISVYDAMGRLVARAGRDVARNVSTTEIRVNGAGVYIVKVGTVAKRVMVND